MLVEARTIPYNAGFVQYRTLKVRFLMPKHKTHKGLARRVKVTATGKVMRKRAGAGHLMSVKNAKRRRNLRRDGQISKSDQAKVLKALGIK